MSGNFLSRVMAALLLMGSQGGALANVISFSSESGFAAQTASTLLTLPVRDSAYVVTIPGELRLSSATAAGANGILSGPDLFPSVFNLAPNFAAKSGNEDWDIAALKTIYSFGFSLYEPTSSATLNGCNSPCVESTFVITLFSGAAQIHSVTVEPTNNVFEFYGFQSSTPITAVTIRETVGTADNEYFGRFFTGTTPLSAVPETGTHWLLSLGIMLLGLRHRPGAA